MGDTLRNFKIYFIGYIHLSAQVKEGMNNNRISITALIISMTIIVTACGSLGLEVESTDELTDQTETIYQQSTR